MLTAKEQKEMHKLIKKWAYGKATTAEINRCLSLEQRNESNLIAKRKEP